MQIKFKINRAQFRAKLDKIIDKMAHTERVLQNIGKQMEKSIRSNFIRQSSPDGQKWRQSVRARLQGGQTLVDTGRLRDSIFSITTGPTTIFTGTNVKYARLMQLGGIVKPTNAKFLRWKNPLYDDVRKGGIGKRTAKGLGLNEFIFAKQVNIPPRPFIGFRDPEDFEAIKGIISRWLGLK